MPVWHEATRKWVKQGRLVLLGVTQEQHADRCRLFAQWKQFDWPILHDPINLMASAAVPIFVAIDEHGIVRSVGPRPETIKSDFLDKVFADTAPKGAPAERRAPELATGKRQPDFAGLRKQAEATGSAAAWRELGDALVLWGGEGRVDEAIDAYTRALEADPRHAMTRFRLGVAHRLRYDSEGRRPGDFQAAVGAWTAALDAEPNRYVWRRRIQQYGPRLDQPYAFYDWIAQAQKEIRARGQTPVAVRVALSGAEVAYPIREFKVEQADAKPPDPQGKITRDSKGLIETEVVVVPAPVRPGQSVRVHVTFRPSAKLKAHWNNEAEPLRLWVTAPAGWQVSRPLLEAPQGGRPETSETRCLEFELKVPAKAQGRARVETYALYAVCEDVGGVCQFLRKDITIEVNVAK